MQDPPRPEQLLEALGAYLFGELRPQVPREERFRVLVAANICAVVARELRAGEQPSIADAELFAAVLGEPGGQGSDRAPELARKLAGRIRAGELDGRLDQLCEALAPHVARKLEVARPGYSD